MPIERAPRKPLPANFQPPGGTPYRVQDGDSWKSLALKNGLDVRALVFFNFLTVNPDEVNWYLRRNTGCNKPTPDGKNWQFSSTARPGVVYLYPRNLTFEPEQVQGDPGRKNRLAIILDDHEDDFELGRIEKLLFVLDIVEVSHSAFEVVNSAFLIAGSDALDGLAEDAGLLMPLAYYVKFVTELGKANLEPLLMARRSEYLRGLSEGIVLGANGAKPSFVRWYFWKEPGSIYNTWYPDAGPSLVGYHNLGIAQGFAYGKQLNSPERTTLFHHLHARMDPNPEETANELVAQGSIARPSDYWRNMTDDARAKYYAEAASVFRLSHLPK